MRPNRRSKAIKKAPKKERADPITKKFSFFYARTAFRGMNNWYKHKFSTSKNVNKESKLRLETQTWKDVRRSIEVMMTDEFGLGDILVEGAYAEREVSLIVITLMLLLHTHRYEKDDLFITEVKA